MDFNIGLSGMNAAQKGLSTSQQNITNVNTEGYARQSVELKENGSASGGGVSGKIGNGVDVSDIKRITDENMLQNLRGQTSKHAYFEEQHQVLNEVETHFGDYAIGSLEELTGGFFEAWEEFSKFPEETSYRSALVGETEKLVGKIKEADGEISRIITDTVEKTEMHMDEVNRLTGNLSEVNERIIDGGENVPSSLLNDRDRILSDLSEYTEVDVTFEKTNPEVATVRSQGSLLVDADEQYEMDLVDNGEVFYFTNGKEKMDLGTGKMNGSLDLVNNNLSGYQDDMLTFSNSLADKVNELHMDGYNQSGETGVAFFTGDSPRQLEINEEIVENPNLIASSSDPEAEGNTDVAKAITNVLHDEVENGLSVQDFVSGIGQDIAQDVNQARSQEEIQQEVKAGLEEQKESYQGVNMDEELGDLMMFQNHYQASARALQTVDEVYDYLFAIV